MNYYPRYPAHYLSKTLHLTMEQDGAYTRLMDWCYANERAIPHAHRYACARATKSSEKRAVDDVLSEFFFETENGWVNSRILKEISKASPRIDAAKANGHKGGRPLKRDDVQNPAGSCAKPSGVPTGVPTGVPSAKAPQSPITNKEKRHTHCPADAGRFADWWAVYPRHENRKRAMDVWRRKRLDGRADELIADVKRRCSEHRPWRDGYIPHPTTYLSGERWDDEIDGGARSGGGERDTTLDMRRAM